MKFAIVTLTYKYEFYEKSEVCIRYIFPSSLFVQTLDKDQSKGERVYLWIIV